MGASFTLGRIAGALGATLEGDPNRLIIGVAPLEKAGRRPEKSNGAAPKRKPAARRVKVAV